MQQPVVKTFSTVPMMALKDRKSFIKAIRTAKRVASGKRAAAACTACKKSRARCDDTRPCKRCRSLGICDGCAMPDLADNDSAKDAKSSVNVRIIHSYTQPSEVMVDLRPELGLNSFTAYRPEETFLNVAMGIQRSSADFIDNLDYGPVGPMPTGSAVAAMLANLNMLKATWNLHQPQQIQQHQHQPQHREPLFEQKPIQFSRTLSSLVLGQQSGPSTWASCPLGTMAAAAGRF